MPVSPPPPSLCRPGCGWAPCPAPTHVMTNQGLLYSPALMSWLAGWVENPSGLECMEPASPPLIIGIPQHH
jgi:hypothetical protein